MPLHPSTFDYLKPTDAQFETMTQARQATMIYAACLQTILPEGPDKTYLMRRIREIGMWANVTITRMPDGSPRIYPQVNYPST